MGWQQDSPDWLVSKGWNWAGPNEVVRYLGIPFSVEPNLNSMWEWIYSKISRKHVKWQTHSLSIAGRFQVVQKVLAAHHLYYALAWLFLSSQVNMIDKILRDFLWSDGKGNRKRHCVKWAWCCQEKK